MRRWRVCGWHSAMRIGVISDTHGLLRPEALTALAGVEHILHAGEAAHFGGGARRLRHEVRDGVFGRIGPAIECRPRFVLHALRTDGGEDGFARAHFRAFHNSWNVFPSGAGKSRATNQPYIAGIARTCPRRPANAFRLRAANAAALR